MAKKETVYTIPHDNLRHILRYAIAFGANRKDKIDEGNFRESINKLAEDLHKEVDIMLSLSPHNSND